EGAAVIAALLDLQEAAGPPLEAVHRLWFRTARCHDVADLDPRRPVQQRPALGPELIRVAQEMIDLGHRGMGIRCQLHGTAGDHDARGRAAAAQPADSLTPLTLCFGRDGAGVDDHSVARARSGSQAAHHLRFEGVQAATEGDDLNLSWHRTAPAPASLK